MTKNELIDVGLLSPPPCRCFSLIYALHVLSTRPMGHLGTRHPPSTPYPTAAQGVFVLKPSVDTFNKLVAFAKDNGSFDGMSCILSD